MASPALFCACTRTIRHGTQSAHWLSRAASADSNEGTARKAAKRKHAATRVFAGLGVWARRVALYLLFVLAALFFCMAALNSKAALFTSWQH